MKKMSMAGVFLRITRVADCQYIYLLQRLCTSVLRSDAAFTLRTYHGNERCSAPILNIHEVIYGVIYRLYEYLGRLRVFGGRWRAVREKDSGNSDDGDGGG